MTEQEILSQYLHTLTHKKDEIKKEIKEYFDENKTKEGFPFILREHFQYTISDFGHKFNMTAPQEIMNNPILVRLSVTETIKIYLDLSRYPEQLLEEHWKNNPGNLSNEDE